MMAPEQAARLCRLLRLAGISLMESVRIFMMAHLCGQRHSQSALRGRKGHDEGVENDDGLLRVVVSM